MISPACLTPVLKPRERLETAARTFPRVEAGGKFMRYQDQARWIADHCGWLNIHESGRLDGQLVAYPPSGLMKYEEIPNYPNDLNAMHEAEKKLDVNQWTEYFDFLDNICVPTHICPTTHALSVICSTSQQRAEAFLKTIGRWKEDEEKETTSQIPRATGNS